LEAPPFCVDGIIGAISARLPRGGRSRANFFRHSRGVTAASRASRGFGHRGLLGPSHQSWRNRRSLFPVIGTSGCLRGNGRATAGRASGTSGKARPGLSSGDAKARGRSYASGVVPQLRKSGRSARFTICFRDGTRHRERIQWCVLALSAPLRLPDPRAQFGLARGHREGAVASLRWEVEAAALPLGIDSGGGDHARVTARWPRPQHTT
jgi:hypothetical protein